MNPLAQSIAEAALYSDSPLGDLGPVEYAVFETYLLYGEKEHLDLNVDKWRDHEQQVRDYMLLVVHELNDNGIDPDEISDEELIELWESAKGHFYGPIVETGAMPKKRLLPFLRGLLTGNPAW